MLLYCMWWLQPDAGYLVMEKWLLESAVWTHFCDQFCTLHHVWWGICSYQPNASGFVKPLEAFYARAGSSGPAGSEMLQMVK